MDGRYYVLMADTGNMLASYRSYSEARFALASIVSQDTSAGDEIALIVYDADGEVAEGYAEYADEMRDLAELSLQAQNEATKGDTK